MCDTIVMDRGLSMRHKFMSLNLPLFVNPIANTLGLTKYQLSTDSTAHKLVLDHIMKNYVFKCAVALMDVTLEAEAFKVGLKSDGVNLPKIVSYLDPNKVILPTSYPHRTRSYLETIEAIEDYKVIATITGPFTLTSLILGFTKTKELLKGNKTQLIRVVEIVYRYLTNYVNDLIKAGICGLFICEPIAGFLTSSECDRFSTKYINKIIDKSSKSIFTIYHNCAKTSPITNSLAKLKVDAYHFGEATNLENIINKLPESKMVMGNLSPLDDFLYSDDKHVKIATLRLLDRMKNYDNFQISFGCELPYETKINNIETYINLTK